MTSFVEAIQYFFKICHNRFHESLTNIQYSLHFIIYKYIDDSGEKNEMQNGTRNVNKILRQQIEIKRKQLFEYAANYGINSQLTIKCSQELDLLLNRLDQNLYHIQSA